MGSGLCIRQTEDWYQNGLASSLDAVQAQEEGWRVLVAFMLAMVDLEALKNEGNAVLRLVVLDLGHGSTDDVATTTITQQS